MLVYSKRRPTRADIYKIIHAALIARVRLGEVKGLQNLRRLSDTRNRSVLAHGHETIQPAQLHQLRHLAGEFVAAIDALHPGEFAGAGSVERLRFIRFGG